VAIGLVALTIVARLAFSGAFRQRRHHAVEAMSLYWHFVDAVWVVVFSVIYLLALV
jgi:heme/copper-type cytochrome/quinol oxidase subunit 3